MTPDQLCKSGTEHSHQRALLAWSNQAWLHGLWFADHDEAYTDKEWRDRFEITTVGIPRLKWLHAIHNQGHGDAIRGARAKAEGVKAGVADCFLPVPKYSFDHETQQTKVYLGLYIEMKKLVGGKPSSEQLDFKRDVEAYGYRHEICAGWKAARLVLIDHLGLIVT